MPKASSKPEKLAASEAALKPGQSYRDLEKGWSSSKKYGPKYNSKLDQKGDPSKAMDAAVAAAEKMRPAAQGPKPLGNKVIAPKKPGGIK